LIIFNYYLIKKIKMIHFFSKNFYLIKIPGLYINFKKMTELKSSNTIKLNLIHNISSNKMLDIRFDVCQTIYEIKISIEKRYGTSPDACELIL